MKYIKSFDGLRAISIIFVLLAHLGVYLYLQGNYFMITRVWPLFSGETGVTIFFVLSGFLITGILLNELNGTGSIRLKQFYIRRALRLLPALLIFFIAVAILMRFHLIAVSRMSFFYSFFYMYNFVPLGIYISELAHTWSLAVEEQFYFTWPFILVFFNSKKAFYAGILLVIICIIVKLVLPHVMVTVDNQAVPVTDHFRTNRWFLPAVAPIIIGSLAAIIIADRPYIAQMLFGNKKQNMVIFFILFFSPIFLPDTWLELAFIFQAIGVVFFLATLLFNQSDRISRALEVTPLVYIGKISYGIYIFQGLFLRNGPGGSLFINKFPLNIILTFLCAVLSYHLIEKPVLRLKTKFR